MAIWVADASRAIAQSGMLAVVIWTVGAAATADDAQMASRIAATLVLSRWHPVYLIVWFIGIFLAAATESRPSGRQNFTMRSIGDTSHRRRRERPHLLVAMGGRPTATRSTFD